MNKEKSLDKFIQEAKDQINSSKAPEHLWHSIADQIADAKLNRSKNILATIIDLLTNTNNRKRTFVFIAATILGILIMKSILNPQLITIYQAEKLAMKLDNSMFLEQEKYENAIKKIDFDYLNQMMLSTNRQTFPYVERLVSLDNTIIKCKSALAINPYSIAVNTSLVSAYQRKISTLNKLTNIMESVS